MTSPPTFIALLGAESTGKTDLATALAGHFGQQGRSVAVVPEVLREWCAHAGRTPLPHEQLAIAQEQARRTEAAQADVVIADTTPLMTAIYSDLLFQDRSLYAFAATHHRLYRHTLVTGLDLPWVADGLQRDGPHVREPVDALLRQALLRAGIAFKVIYGQGLARLDNAIRAVLPGGASTNRPVEAGAPWNWVCDKCSDPVCEHRLFSRLVKPAGD